MFTPSTHPKLSLPQVYYDAMQPIIVEGKRLCYQFPEPMEDPFKSGFFIIPDYSGYSISRDGTLYSRHAARTLAFHKVAGSNTITGGYYRRRGIMRDDGVSGSVSRHRLLALTFLPYRGHPDDYWVNHKNGIPGDDVLDNLEWVTAGENIKHAYRNNLHPTKVRSIDAWHVDSREPLRFNSVVEATEHTGLSHSLISGRLRRPDRNGVLYSDGWRFKDTFEEWAPFDVHLNRTSNQVGVNAVNVLTGEVSEFPSFKAAGRVLSILPCSIQMHCRRGSRKPLGGYLFSVNNNSPAA